MSLNSGSTNRAALSPISNIAKEPNAAKPPSSPVIEIAAKEVCGNSLDMMDSPDPSRYEDAEAEAAFRVAATEGAIAAGIASLAEEFPARAAEARALGEGLRSELAAIRQNENAEAVLESHIASMQARSEQLEAAVNTTAKAVAKGQKTVEKRQIATDNDAKTQLVLSSDSADQCDKSAWNMLGAIEGRMQQQATTEGLIAEELRKAKAKMWAMQNDVQITANSNNEEELRYDIMTEDNGAYTLAEFTEEYGAENGVAIWAHCPVAPADSYRTDATSYEDAEDSAGSDNEGEAARAADRGQNQAGEEPSEAGGIEAYRNHLKSKVRMGELTISEMHAMISRRGLHLDLQSKTKQLETQYRTIQTTAYMSVKPCDRMAKAREVVQQEMGEKRLKEEQAAVKRGDEIRALTAQVTELRRLKTNVTNAEGDITKRASELSTTLASAVVAGATKSATKSSEEGQDDTDAGLPDWYSSWEQAEGEAISAAKGVVDKNCASAKEKEEEDWYSSWSQSDMTKKTPPSDDTPAELQKSTWFHNMLYGLAAVVIFQAAAMVGIFSALNSSA